MINQLDIRRKMLGYISGNLDVDQFEDWVVQNTWNVHVWGDSETVDLAHELDAKLAEYSSDLITESMLQKDLSMIARTYHLSLGIGDGVLQQIVTSASNDLSSVALTLGHHRSAQSIGIQFELASV